MALRNTNKIYHISMSIPMDTFNAQLKSGELKVYAKEGSVYQYIDAQGDLWRIKDLSHGWATLVRGSTGSSLDVPPPDKLN